MAKRRGKASTQDDSVHEGNAGPIKRNEGKKTTKFHDKRNTTKGDAAPVTTTQVTCATCASSPPFLRSYFLTFSRQASETVSVDENMDHLFRLRKFALSETSLREHGYMLENYSPDELELKKRCQGCGKSELCARSMK